MPFCVARFSTCEANTVEHKQELSIFANSGSFKKEQENAAKPHLIITQKHFLKS